MNKKIKITEDQEKALRKHLEEAVKTACQTPEAMFHTKIEGKSIECKVTLPMVLNLSNEESKTLEGNIHNAMELVLSKYFVKD